MTQVSPQGGGREPNKPTPEDVKRFWLIVHEPGRVPERKGSWPSRDLAKVMREFIAARPTAYLTILTVNDDGVPEVQHGPEALQMADGRSMAVGARHNARTLAAHARTPASTSEASEQVEALRGEVERLRAYHKAVEGLISTWAGSDHPAQFYPNGEGDCDDDEDQDRWDKFVAARRAIARATLSHAEEGGK